MSRRTIYFDERAELHLAKLEKAPGATQTASETVREAISLLVKLRALNATSRNVVDAFLNEIDANE